MLDITGGIPVGTDVAVAVVHPLDVPQVAPDSLPSTMVHGTCGNLCLLLGADDHPLMFTGSTLVFGVNKLDSTSVFTSGYDGLSFTPHYLLYPQFIKLLTCMFQFRLQLFILHLEHIMF